MSTSPDDTTSPLKTCTKCKQSFPATAEFFARNQWHCKKCQAKYRADNREKRSAYNAQHYANKREYYTERHIEYNANHRERLTEYNAEHYANNREKYAKHHAEWRANNPEKCRTYKQQRRARVRALPYEWTAQDERRAMDYFGGLCAYCSKQADSLFTGNHLDHYIPLSDIANCPGTVPGNMLPTCQQCNLSKHDNAPFEWITRTFGKRKAAKILARIDAFFASLKEANHE